MKIEPMGSPVPIGEIQYIDLEDELDDLFGTAWMGFEDQAQDQLQTPEEDQDQPPAQDQPQTPTSQDSTTKRKLRKKRKARGGSGSGSGSQRSHRSIHKRRAADTAGDGVGAEIGGVQSEGEGDSPTLAAPPTPPIPPSLDALSEDLPDLEEVSPVPEPAPPMSPHRIKLATLPSKFRKVWWAVQNAMLGS